MANRSWSNAGHFYAPHVFPVLLDCNWAVGSSGAVSALKGPGVSAVTRLAAGIYKIKFQDNYTKFFGFNAKCKAPVTGSNVAATALSAGTVYEITALGTTTTANWVTAGVPAGITPAVGVSFLAAATSSGNGTAKAIGVSGVSDFEVVGVSNTTLSPSGSVSYIGGYIIIQCLGATSSSVTTLIPTDPASGSSMFVSIYLGNSSIIVQGE
jgi:hypothetical protein